MRLMTFGKNSYGKIGLIEISEAKDNNRQEIVFTVPIVDDVALEINSKKDFFAFLGDTPILSRVILDNEIKTTNIIPNKLKQTLSIELHGQLIIFEIENELNFNKSFSNIRIPKFKNLSAFQIVKIAAIYIAALFKEFLSSIIIESLPTFINYKHTHKGIKNCYVGVESEKEFENMKFIILTLKNVEVLDSIYFEYKTFFIN